MRLAHMRGTMHAVLGIDATDCCTLMQFRFIHVNIECWWHGSSGNRTHLCKHFTRVEPRVL
jgi:hypothetical protein